MFYICYKGKIRLLYEIIFWVVRWEVNVSNMVYVCSIYFINIFWIGSVFKDEENFYRIFKVWGRKWVVFVFIILF